MNHNNFMEYIIKINHITIFNEVIVFYILKMCHYQIFIYKKKINFLM